MSNGSLFSRLQHQKTPHVFITGEAEDFDQQIILDWQNEGFATTYVSFGTGGPDFVREVKATAEKVVGVGERYAIVAFGSPGTPLLASLRHLPHLNAMIAYYPPQMPSPSQTTYPPDVHVQLHLIADSTIGVTHRPEVLGMQSSKERVTRKTIGSGSGLGGGLELAGKASVVQPGTARTWVYAGVRAGFAESAFTAHSPTAAALAWSRALACVRRAHGIAELDLDLEGVRDRFSDGVADAGLAAETVARAAAVPGSDEPAEVSRINLPTLTGGFGPEGLAAFYSDMFGPSAGGLRARLLSRTVGAAQVVDEVLVRFRHDREVEWVLPRVPPTGKDVSFVMVSVVGIKGGRCVSERVYWDQASVLVQIGMLDPALVPSGFGGGGKGVTKGKLRMPVVGIEQAEAVEQGDDWDGVVNELVDELEKSSIS